MIRFVLIAISLTVVHGCKPLLRGCYVHSGSEKNLLHSDNSEDKHEDFFSGTVINWDNFGSYLQKAACRCNQAAAKAGFPFFSLRDFGECHGIGKGASSFSNLNLKKSIYCFGTDLGQCDTSNHNHCTGAEEAEFIYETKPDIVCNFIQGDGIGGSEKYVGITDSAAQCITRCSEMRKANPNINGVTIGASSGNKKRCYCEMKMQRTNNSPSWKTCFLQKESHINEPKDTVCNFIQGDGIGGSENYVGITDSAAQCISRCSEMKLANPNINGVTIGASSGNKKKCYCEMKMQRTNNSPSWKTCFLQKESDIKESKDTVCNFIQGDGIGGSENYVGITDSAAQCISRCSEMKIANPNINGVTIGASSGNKKKCYCEMKMQRTNNSPSWKTCFLQKESDIKESKDTACNFIQGDGIGGSEKYVGITDSAAQCISRCSKMRKANSNINGVTIGASSGNKKKCYCEMKMQRTNNSPSWKTCFLQKESDIKESKENTICNFIQGDGVGGPEKFVGITESAGLCIKRCSEMRKTNPNINGVTIGASSGGRILCYCEMKMTKSNKSPRWKTCFLKNKILL